MSSTPRDAGTHATPSRLVALAEAIGIAATVAITIMLLRSLGGLGGYSGEIGLLLALALATWLIRREGRSWKHLGLVRPDRWRPALRLIPIAYFGVFASIAIGQLVLVQGLGLDAPSSSGNNIEGDFWGFVVRVTVISWGTAAFGEELLARGFLMDRFGRVFSGSRHAHIMAAAAQALLFGAAHPGQGLAGMIIVGCVGFVFGLVYLKANRNLWPVILTHGIADTISFTLLYLGITPS
ncbi:MAG: CPBP family intramembrane metalloprotease [Acidobacteria bacterium]|nr:CPBP family intramembrane metalloprotease [Acidobacteriota bacterium]